MLESEGEIFWRKSTHTCCLSDSPQVMVVHGEKVYGRDLVKLRVIIMSLLEIWNKQCLESEFVGSVWNNISKFCCSAKSRDLKTIRSACRHF
jgi:hypothetical protein